MAKFSFGKGRQQAKLALDIGSKYIKALEIGYGSHGIVINNMGFAATPLGSVTEGTINNPEAIGEMLKQIVKHFNIKEKKAVCSLPGRAVVIRQVTLPAGLSDKELKVAAIGEVERFLPFPLDEMEYDYEVLGEIQQGDTKQTSVLFIAAHREAVQKRVEAAHIAGLESYEIDVDPFVILRSVVESAMFSDQDTFTQTFLLLDLGASSTNVSIMKNGVLRFTRIFSIGGDTLTHAIESGTGANYLDAEKLKKDLAVAYVDEEFMQLETDAKEIHEMVRPHLETLSLEIRRSLAYYTSKYRGESVTKMVITGGGAMLKGIAKFFEEDLAIPVVHANPFRNLIYVGDEEVDKISSLVPFFSVAAGLGIRQVPQKVQGKYCLNVVIEPNYEFGSATQAASLSS